MHNYPHQAQEGQPDEANQAHICPISNDIVRYGIKFHGDPNYYEIKHYARYLQTAVHSRAFTQTPMRIPLSNIESVCHFNDIEGAHEEYDFNSSLSYLVAITYLRTHRTILDMTTITTNLNDDVDGISRYVNDGVKNGYITEGEVIALLPALQVAPVAEEKREHAENIGLDRILLGVGAPVILAEENRFGMFHGFEAMNAVVEAEAYAAMQQLLTYTIEAFAHMRQRLQDLMDRYERGLNMDLEVRRALPLLVRMLESCLILPAPDGGFPEMNNTVLILLIGYRFQEYIRREYDDIEPGEEDINRNCLTRLRRTLEHFFTVDVASAGRRLFNFFAAPSAMADEEAEPGAAPRLH
jgi:hypothetical protein